MNFDQEFLDYEEKEILKLGYKAKFLPFLRFFEPINARNFGANVFFTVTRKKSSAINFKTPF